MSIGTGIFLSSLLLGLIYLFLKTRKDWNWRRILIITTVITSLVMAIILITVFWDELLKKSSDTDTEKKYSGIIQSYQGISLGEKITNLEFKYGRLKPQGKTLGNVPIYTIETKPSLVIYKNLSSDSVDFLGVDCTGSKDSFNGIKCGMNSDELLKQHGNKVKVWCPKELAKDEDPYRVYDIAEFGTRFILSKNQVIHIRIYKPNEMKNPISLKECD
jgi:hypothetical protein